MRTAIVSDLHLGVASDEDVLRDADVRRVLFAEIAGADRLVLLGDAVELRNLPLGPSLERSRPFFEELGEALGEVEVTLVPGNHDARLAEPLLDELSIAGEPALGLERHHPPSPGPAA
ncbi:MAG TPA: metallophosphoesterase, partial [Solirubrobacterales bacterium]